MSAAILLYIKCDTAEAAQALTTHHIITADKAVVICPGQGWVGEYNRYNNVGALVYNEMVAPCVTSVCASVLSQHNSNHQGEAACAAAHKAHMNMPASAR